jgi:hypothetical protein
MIDVRDDRKIADEIHVRFGDVTLASDWSYDGSTVAARLISRSDVKARRAVPESKKRHVERMTRLPTKRMATACWAFIVAKSTLRKTAPLLDFLSLRVPNIEFHPQLIHKSMWTAWG